MSWKIATVVATVCLALATASLAQQRQLTPKEEAFRDRVVPAKVQARRGSGDLGTGVIQYDPGSPADVTGAGTGQFVGNTFNSRNGGPLSFPGSVTQVSWYIGRRVTVLNSAFKVVAPGVTIGSAPGFYAASSYAFNVAPIPTGSRLVSGPFFAGFVDLAGTFASLGRRSATTNGQGFHGVQRDFSVGQTTPLPGQNAMVRISGDVVIPVELLEFEVE